MLIPCLPDSMRKFIHLSDIHFGPRFVPHLGQVVLEEIAALDPDAVVISGDFTLRGRHNEYILAREFIKQISKPVLTIPGNHDQPLFAPIERLLTPYARYRRYIHPTVDMSLAVDGLFMLGLSDCRPILPGGFWSRQQRAWIREQLACAPEGAARVVVSHHQFQWGGKWRPAGFWYPNKTLDWLARQNVELVLNGHTHIPAASQLDSGIVVARAGTATSDRVRHGWGNSYNVISIDPAQIAISVREYDSQADGYLAKASYVFARRRNSE